MLPESGHLCQNSVSPDFDDQTGRIPAIWPERPDGRIRPAGQIWPERLASRIDLAKISRPKRPDFDWLAGRIWPENLGHYD
jgi:hypothetical protein